MKRICILMLAMLLVHFMPVAAQNETPEQALEKGERALEQGMYNLADFYADKALKKENTAKRAAEIKIQAMSKLAKTQVDSLKTVVALLELHDKDKANPVFMRLLMEYFSWPGREKDMMRFADDEIRKDSTNAWAWAIKAETQMQSHLWDEAITNYRRALDMDSTIVVEVEYNIGVCYSSKAVELKDSCKVRKRKENKEQILTIKKWLEAARDSFEIVQARDPECLVVDWRRPLYQVYYALGDKKAKKIAKSLKLNVK